MGKDIEENSQNQNDSQTNESHTSTAPELPEDVTDLIKETTGEDRTKPEPAFRLSKRWYAGLAGLALVAMLAGYFGLNLAGNKQPANTTTVQESVKRYGVAVGLVEGSAQYSTDSGSSWQTLTADTDLAEKHQIRTDSGRVVLLIDDGSAVRLGYGSTVELTSLVTDSIVVTNLGGEVYNRVVAAESRQFQSVAGDQTFTAKGTAYRTFNTSTKKGVEVYHSTVKAEEKETDVTEGNALFTLAEQKEKENIVTAIDLASLKKDEFLRWNSEQDKKSEEFAKALGVLVEFDKPDPAPAPTPAPTTSNKSGITLSVSVTEYTANFSWKVSGVDTSKGFKLVKSKSSQSPTYPENSAAFVESGKSSYNLYLGDGKTYYFRICAYRDGSCDSYSNTVTVTTPVKQKEQIVSGSVTLTITGSQASWNFNGTAPYGFKLVISESQNPTYPSSFNKYSDSQSAPLPDGLTSGNDYYARVCKYSYDGTCVDYSNQVQFTAP